MMGRDFKEVVQSLNESDLQYLIVGGYAVALRGHSAGHRLRRLLRLRAWVS